MIATTPRAECPPALKLELPGTKAYARRGLYWCPSATGDVADPFDVCHRVPGVGQLAIVRARDFATRPPEVLTCWYAVEPVPTGRRDVVAYMLCKLTPGGQDSEVYEVTGGATGRRCTCPAGTAGKPCVHLDGIAALIAAKALPGPKAVLKPR